MAEKRHVSFEDALSILNLSRSTLLRRLKEGSIPAHKERGRWLIEVPESTGDVPPETVETLKAQMALLTQERDFLRQQVEALQNLIHEQNVIIQTMQTQRLLPAPGKRPWWRFWERGEGEQGQE